MADLTPLPPKQEPKVPTVEEINRTIHFLVATVLLSFQKLRINATTINSVGSILANLKFDGTQSDADMNAMVRTAAEKELEVIKALMLRDSIMDYRRNNSN